MSAVNVTSIPNTAIYEGRDPVVRMVSICEGCKNEPNSTSLSFSLLRLCTGCRVVRYCSKECQKNDFSKHKLCCRKINKLALSMNKEANMLLSDPEWGNIFQEHTGNFWEITESHKYMRARAC